MTHETRTGRTHDGVPWVITLHPDGTASAMLPSLEGGTYPQALSGDAGRYLANELPNVEAMIGDIENILVANDHPAAREQAERAVSDWKAPGDNTLIRPLPAADSSSRLSASAASPLAGV